MKVILVQPGLKQTFGYKAPPLSLLPLAGTLKDSGYEVEIFDARRHDYKEMQLDGAVCVGITVLTGQQILHALAISEYVKKTNPSIPVVWGGIHPSLLPVQTAENEFIDVVVKGEGEQTLLELVSAFEKKTPLSGIKGIVYKLNGKIKENPDRPFMDFNKAAMHPYELLKDIETYDTNFEVHIQTSRGCPHNCGFCYNRNFNKLSYRCKSLERVMYEIEWIIKNLGIRRIHFDEDNFFVIQDRVRMICEELIKRKLNIIWESTCRLDYFSRYDPSFLKLLKDSGCESLQFGGESGSQRILDYVKKEITIDQIVRAVEKARDAGITPIVSFVCGFPTETKKDIRLTLDLISKLKKLNKGFVVNGLFIFSPYPKTPLFEDAVKHGLKEPQRLEDWGYLYFSNIAAIDWFDKKYKKYMLSVSKVIEIMFLNTRPHLKLSPNQLLKFLAANLLKLSATLRFKLRFFALPVELELYEKFHHRDVEMLAKEYFRNRTAKPLTA